MGKYIDAVRKGAYTPYHQQKKEEEAKKQAVEIPAWTDNPVFTAVEQLNPLALVGDVTRAFNPDSKFADFIDPTAEARRIREQRYPVANIIGEVGGALIGGAGLAKGLAKGATKVLPKFGAKLAAGSVPRHGTDSLLPY